MGKQDNQQANGRLLAGTQVHVSNGAPEPPVRFKNKHSQWECDNYDGVVIGYEGGTFPGYRVQRTPKCGWTSDCYWMVMIEAGVKDGAVSAIPGAPMLPVVTGATVFDVVVDSEAIKAAADIAA